MRTGSVSLLAVGILLATAACAANASGRALESAPDPRLANAIVLSGSELARAGSLLESMSGRVRNLRVERRPGRCPDVHIRGDRTIVYATYPLIYVDGSPFRETCVLEQIRVTEVERVEIYPSGFTTRPGYRTSPYGLILVFLTGGEVESSHKRLDRLGSRN